MIAINAQTVEGRHGKRPPDQSNWIPQHNFIARGPAGSLPESDPGPILAFNLLMPLWSFSGHSDPDLPIEVR